jgi:hypothetical protein
VSRSAIRLEGLGKRYGRGRRASSRVAAGMRDHRNDAAPVGSARAADHFVRQRAEREHVRCAHRRPRLQAAPAPCIAASRQSVRASSAGWQRHHECANYSGDCATSLGDSDNSRARAATGCTHSSS